MRYQDKPVLVVQEDGKTWIAIVGIPLKSAPGPHQVTTSDGRTLSFTVGTSTTVSSTSSSRTAARSIRWPKT